jgi:hypothetical protein
MAQYTPSNLSLVVMCVTFQGAALLGHAQATYTFFCFLYDMARQNKHMTPTDYKRRGMTPPMKKTSIFAAMLSHAFGGGMG